VYNYFLEGNYEEARPLLENDFYQSWKEQQYESATNAGLTLAKIYLKQQKIQPAMQVMDRIEGVVLSKRHIRWMRSWFENQFELAKQTGNLSYAAMYADSALTYREMAATTANMQILANSRSKVEAERYLNQISLLEGKRQKALVLRNALMAGIVLISIILLLIINRARARHAFEVEKAMMEKKQSEALLQQVHAQLHQYTLHLKEKTLLIEQVERELDQLKQQGKTHAAVSEQTLGQLLQSSILTEEEWQHFRELFERVHPGFLIKMRQQFPDLTPAETRMLVLARLKLTNKEMMAMLGIGYDAIKKSRQRLRKKINLPDDISLESWIEKI
jgi:DNA-binding CsgD family transcriptional regulator/competence protein ComGC